MKTQPRIPSQRFFKILLWGGESLLAIGAVLAATLGLPPKTCLVLFCVGSLLIAGPLLFLMWMFGGVTERTGPGQREVPTRIVKIMPYLAATVVAISVIRLILLVISRS